MQSTNIHWKIKKNSGQNKQKNCIGASSQKRFWTQVINTFIDGTLMEK